MTIRILCGLWILAFLSGSAFADKNATIPGKVTAPYPTLMNLAVEWAIRGDENLNGAVQVRYREEGKKEWREAMDLRRVPAGKREFLEGATHEWENKHSGSLFDLKPNTRYEVALKLSDPDGGTAQERISIRTRREPRPAARAAIRRVTPQTIHSGKPGDILLLAPGNYGSYEATADGTRSRPIVFRSLDGKANFSFFSLRGRKYVHLEGITIRNDAPRGKGVDLNRAEQCVVRYCTIHATYGVRAAASPGATNCYIADNTISGPSVWAAEAMGAHGDNRGDGIELTGPGNVICFNRVSGFRDCISTMEGNIAPQACIDIYNNDLFNSADDGIEADFCFHNCRVMRNRITNSYVAMSSQPGLGGPNYFIRNVAYNAVHAAFKLKRDSVGDVCLHNTVVKIGTGLGGNSPMDHAYFRNNLCIGGPTGGVKWGGYGAGLPMAADVISPGEHSSFDYDAVGVYEVPFRAKIGGLPFEKVEPHGIRVDMSLFSDVEFPNPPVPARAAVDLRPRAGSPVEDSAMRIPNINDDFLGKGPDRGAYEVGQPLPHYGPRPRRALDNPK